MPSTPRTRTVRRRGFGLVALWLTCAVTAAMVGVGAVSVVRAAVRDEPVQVLSPTDVAAALGDAGPTLQPLAAVASDADELEQEWEGASPTPSATGRADDSGHAEGADRSGSDDGSGSGRDGSGRDGSGRGGSGSDDRSGSGSDD